MSDPLAHIHGPAFLLLYAVFAAGVLLAVRAWLRRPGAAQGGESPPRELDQMDPVSVAYLRGGVMLALKTAVHRLLALGYLEAKDETTPKGATLKNLAPAEVPPPGDLSHPFDQQVLDDIRVDGDVRAVARNKLRQEELQRALEQHVAPVLVRQGLLVSKAADQSRRLSAVAVASALLLGLAAWRVAGSIERGHSNLIFLGIEILVAVVLMMRLKSVRMTAQGRSYLAAAAAHLESQPSLKGPGGPGASDGSPDARGATYHALAYALLGSAGLVGGMRVLDEVFRSHGAYGLGAGGDSGCTGCTSCTSCTSCSSCSSCSSCGGCGGY